MEKKLPPPDPKFGGFALTAKLNELTIEVDRPQLSQEDIAKLHAAMKQKAQSD
jgi:arylsulfatase